MKKGQPKGVEYDAVNVSADLDTGIRPTQMKDFKNKVKEGGVLTGRKGNIIRVLKIYPNFVITNDGTYQWIDLYMHNKRHRTSTDDGYEFRFKFKEE